jgi:hypothetical protein
MAGNRPGRPHKGARVTFRTSLPPALADLVDARRGESTRIDYLNDVIRRLHPQVEYVAGSDTARPVLVEVGSGPIDEWPSFTLRLPAELAEVVIAAAAERGQSRRSYLRNVVAHAHGYVQPAIDQPALFGERDWGVPA